MKKRQKPILMITILLLFVGAAVGFNYLSDPTRGDSAPDMTAAPRQEDTTQLANKAASQMSTKPKMAAMPHGPQVDLVKKSHSAPTKPVPNDSSIGSGWYRDDAAGNTPK